MVGGLLNPLNTELNPNCHLLALLGANHIFHVGRIRVNNELARISKERSLTYFEARLWHMDGGYELTKYL